LPLLSLDVLTVILDVLQHRLIALALKMEDRLDESIHVFAGLVPKLFDHLFVHVRKHAGNLLHTIND
jgi:hypothetical protein